VALVRINLTAFYHVRRTAQGWLADWIFFRAAKFVTADGVGVGATTQVLKAADSVHLAAEVIGA